MSKSEKDLHHFLSSFESSAVKKLMDQQSTQGIDGTLRVQTDRVYVDRRRGEHALLRLSEMIPANLK